MVKPVVKSLSSSLDASKTREAHLALDAKPVIIARGVRSYLMNCIKPFVSCSTNLNMPSVVRNYIIARKQIPCI